MDSSALRDSARAVTVFLVALIAIALIGSRVKTGIAFVFWGAVVTALALAAVVVARNFRSWTFKGALVAVTLALPSLAGVAAIVRFLSFYDGGVPIQFTRNDMIMNTIEALTIHQHGGLGVGDEAKPVFMTSTFTSLFYGPGTSFLPLLTMLYGNVAATATICVITSLFIAWFTFDSLRSAAVPWRIGAALVLAWIPFTRHIFGAVMFNGYMNIPVMFLVLVLAWILYRMLEPRHALIWLPLLIIVSLATWSPASLMPGLLLIVALIQLFIDPDAQRPERKELVLTGLSWAAVAVYFLTISLPSLRADGDYLSAGPGNLAGDFADHLIIAGVTLVLLMLLYGTLAPRRHAAPVLGTGALLIGGWLAVFYLLTLREPGDSRWGYYPLKMLWIATIFVAVIMTIELLVMAFERLETPEGQEERRLRRGLMRTASATLSVAVFVAGILLPTSYVGLRRTVMPILARDALMPDEDQKRIYDELVDVFDAHPGEPIVFIRQADGVEYDGDRNRFLIQFSAPTSHDVRIHAYRDWNEKYYQMLCPLLRAWDKDSTLVTSSKGLDETKKQLGYCGLKHDVDFIILDH